MIRTLLIFSFILSLPLLQSCAGVSIKPQFREDPLINKIVNAHTGKFITFKTLVDRLETRDVIYLSEKHDNPMHHMIQHRIIQELVDRGHLPIIGFEFFSMEKTPHILNFRDSARVAHSEKQERFIEEDLRGKLGWDLQKDQMWAYYLDLMKLGRDNGLTMAGLDLSNAAKRRITRKGMDELTSIEKKQLFSTGLSNPAYQEYMKSIFKAVHCGMGHGKMTARLYDTWRARNDKMALSITQLHEKNTKSPIVIIMGNGHTEYGLGVMDRVTAIAPDLSQVNMAMAEITREPSGLEEYLPLLDLEGYKPVPPADYLWLTQRVSYEDPCLKFKKMFEKMKPRKKN